MPIQSTYNQLEVLHAKLAAINNLLAKHKGDRTELKKNKRNVLKEIKKLEGK